MQFKGLPAIQVQRHRRALQFKLSIDGQKIRLTAPIFATQRQIQQFIAQSETWLRETWQQQQTKIQHSLPTQLQLFNQQQPISIIYQLQKNNFIFDLNQQCLYVSDRSPQAYLQSFILAYAKQHLPTYLQQVSQALKLPYQSCSVRQVKTRWGSCSQHQQIMLNSALVLCPLDLVRYVIIHELAHTIHFNHSADFWALVAIHDPHLSQHRRELKQYCLDAWYTYSS